MRYIIYLFLIWFCARHKTSGGETEERDLEGPRGRGEKMWGEGKQLNAKRAGGPCVLLLEREREEEREPVS
jgi:hypothetical protein